VVRRRHSDYRSLTYEVAVESEAGGVTVGQDPRYCLAVPHSLEGGDVPPELDEDSREPGSPVGGRAVLDTNTRVTVRVGHVGSGALWVNLLAVPARREGDLRSEATVAGLKALREAVLKDGVATVSTVAGPAYTSRVVAIGALHGVSSDHVEALWEAGDVCPVVSVTKLVVDLAGHLGYTVETICSVAEEQGWAPVQRLVGLDTGSGARRANQVGVARGSTQSISSIERVEMRALTSGEESGVKTLVAHSITGAVVHAKVVAIALGRGSCS
jgi:hypothetical protein